MGDIQPVIIIGDRTIKTVFGCDSCREAVREIEKGKLANNERIVLKPDVNAFGVQNGEYHVSIMRECDKAVI